MVRPGKLRFLSTVPIRLHDKRSNLQRVAASRFAMEPMGKTRFVFVHVRPGNATPETTRRKWDIPQSNATAVIVDAPGEDGVELGLALCDGGYRPIPVYNACPYATYDPFSAEVPSIQNPAAILNPALVEEYSRACRFYFFKALANALLMVFCNAG